MVTVVQLGSPPPDTATNSIDLNTADVNRHDITGGTAIRLIATMTSNTPITNVTVTSRLDWQCSFGHTNHIGVAQNAPLAFAPPIPAAPNSTTLKVDSVVDPVAMSGCAVNPSVGFGPVNLRGGVSISATDSAGTSTSKSFVFYYRNVGSP
jgi:hypothetical protein